jgi:ribosomal protein S18 acetylase RimI-like enzyme
MSMQECATPRRAPPEAGLLIRAAAPADIPALDALVQSAYRGDSARAGWTHEADLLGGQRTDPGMLAAMLSSASTGLLVAEHDSVLVGCVATEDRGDYGYVSMVTVAPVQQGGGLGRTLLEAAEQHIRGSFGLSRARMSVISLRAELIGWYERRGYRDTGETAAFPYGDSRFGAPVRDDLAFVILEKQLG